MENTFGFLSQVIGNLGPRVQEKIVKLVRSWAKISQRQTLFVQRLKKKIGKVSAGKTDQIVEVLNELMGGPGGFIFD
jgi:phage-related protein